MAAFIGLGSVAAQLLVPLAAEHAEMAQFGVNADMLRVQTEFNVNLSDYNVSIFAPLAPILILLALSGSAVRFSGTRIFTGPSPR